MSYRPAIGIIAPGRHQIPMSPPLGPGAMPRVVGSEHVRVVHVVPEEVVLENVSNRPQPYVLVVAPGKVSATIFDAVQVLARGLLGRRKP